jgi:hypothetical protein
MNCRMAQDRSQACTCGICGGQSNTRTGVSPSTPVFPYHYHFAILLSRTLRQLSNKHCQAYCRIPGVVEALETENLPG